MDGVRRLRPVWPLPGLPIPLIFRSDVEGHTHGMELSTSYRVLQWWRLHAGYTLLQESLHVKPGAVDFNDAHSATAAPQQQASLRSAWIPGSRLDLNAALLQCHF